jgi:DNA modification methylase
VNYEELGKFDTVFTSPPYFNTEIYSEDQSQSCQMYPRIKDWLEQFLFCVLGKVIEVLLPGGTLMINIKDSKKNAIVEPMLQFLRNHTRLVEGNHIKFIQSKRYKNIKHEYIYMWHFPKSKIVFTET